MSILTRRGVLAGLGLPFIPSPLLAQQRPLFKRPLKLERPPSGHPPGSYALSEDFEFLDKDGVTWRAPRGHVVDGASIPPYLWSIIGAPFTDLYTEAAVIHDVYCDLRTRPWRRTHDVFYEAMLANGVDRTKAMIMYTAVMIAGPRWLENVSYDCPPRYACSNPVPTRIVALKITPNAGSADQEARIKQELQRLHQAVLDEGEDSYPRIAVEADESWYRGRSFEMRGVIESFGASITIDKRDDIDATTEYFVRAGGAAVAGEGRQFLEKLQRR